MKEKEFIREFVNGPYTRIFKNECNHCNNIFYHREIRKYCLIIEIYIQVLNFLDIDFGLN